MADRIEVETYSGYRADERPLRFTLDSESHEIAEVESRWRSPDAACFRVRTREGRRCLLRHDPRSDTWSCEFE